MFHNQREWSDSDLSRIRQRLSQRATFRTIAEEFNTTKAAVGGVVSRNNLNGLSHHKAVVKPRPVATAQRTAKFFPDHRKSVNPHTTGNALKDLKCEASPRATSFAQCHGCLWPIGNGLWCNRGKIPNFSYCPRHHRRAYRAADPG